jgi:hypothetical protein
MAPSSYEFISRATRRVFRDLAAGVPYKALAEYWQDERFTPDPTVEITTASIRRSTYDSYANTVDWTDLRQMERVLRVFESILRYYRRQPGHDPKDFEEVREALADDGLRLDDRYKIQWECNPGLNAELANLTDPTGIRTELERVRRALPDDPAGAIGAAKQLIEATAKVVLHERGQPIDDKADVPDLIKAAQQALRLHPSSAVPGPDGSDALKKILGGMTAIAIGIAELRNRGYGSGHGQTRAPVGLGARHAHLAVNAATTWCQILLDTLADSAAPWRSSTVSANGANSTSGASAQTQSSQPIRAGRPSRSAGG